jgi:hypothetical protein
VGRIRTAAIGGLVEDNPLAAAATTLTSAGLSALPLFAAGDFALVVFDPDGRTGEPFAKRITAHGSNAVTATIEAAAIYGTARQIDRDTPWHLTDILDQDGNGSGLIGLTAYDPVSQSGVNVPAASALGDFDATNLRVSFVAPPSGKVKINLSCFAEASAGAYMEWSLRNLSNVVPTGGEGQLTISSTSSAAVGSRPYATFVVTGLTPGTTYTYKWSIKNPVNTSTTAIAYYGGGTGPAVMEVWAVNI